MALTTIHYGIKQPVEFVDVDVDVDNRLFIDPHAIRLHREVDVFGRDAVTCLDSFLDVLLDCIRRKDRVAGLRLLQRFSEPRETRLGMARAGFSGHGGADDVGEWIWDALTTDLETLVKVGIFGQIEDLPMFIDGIDADITSDITTRLVFGPLGDFTAAMTAKYPEFTLSGHQLETVTRMAWDVGNREWATMKFELPSVEGSPLLLVPERWTRSRLLMSGGRYYETSVLTYIQGERAVVDPTGKTVTTPKRELRRMPGAGRGRATNLSTTMRAHHNGDDLLAIFKQFVLERWLLSQESAA